MINDLPGALAVLILLAVGLSTAVTYMMPGLAANTAAVTVSEQEPTR